jgi:hypothetical protein
MYASQWAFDWFDKSLEIGPPWACRTNSWPKVCRNLQRKYGVSIR